MLIPITPSTNTSTTRKPDSHRSVNAGTASDAVQLQGWRERRRQPDRRRNRESQAEMERRRRTDRRRPELLNARTGKPERLHGAKGRSINTQA